MDNMNVSFVINNKLDIYNTIRNKDIPYEKLAEADHIKIDKFVNAFSHQEEELKRKEIKITYGVNVRISNNSDKDILPFSYSYPPFDSVGAAKDVDTGKNIPDFVRFFHLKEITFSAQKSNNPGQKYLVSEIKDILVDAMGKNVSFKDTPFDNSDLPNRDFNSFFNSGITFLDVNSDGLKISQNETMYVWICGEDPDVSMNSEKTYLTNIVAITNDHDTLKRFVDEKRIEILKFVMLLKSRRTDDFYIKQREEANKSAKAAIMSRNMSHNLGSHVMSYLKQHLGTVKEMLNDKILSILYKDEDDLIQKRGLIIEDGKDPIEQNVALPFLIGLGKFISYLQERQDFIATIATDFIPYYSNVNFKDSIYDELNPDKRNERHSERTTSQTTDNILLGNIARSEGLGRPTSPTGKIVPINKTELTDGLDTRNIAADSTESTEPQFSLDLRDIIIKFRNFDGNAVEKKEKTGNITIINEEGHKSLEEMRKYDVSLPGGVVGRQAVFSIVENVIRNAAKHGHREQNQDLELTFDIFTKEDILAKDDDKERYKPSTNDNCNENHLSLSEVLKTYYLGVKTVEEKTITTVEDADDLYFVTLTDNLPFSENSLGELRKALMEDYVNDKGVMNEGNKGIKEIRISAAWLRSIKDEKGLNTLVPFDEIQKLLKKEPDNNAAIVNDAAWIQYVLPETNNKKYAPNVYARISDGHLQYIFCLLRPKKVAIISERFKDGQNYDRTSFIANSWGAFASESFIKDVSNKSYEFILIENDDDYDSVRVVTSSRTLKISELNKDGYIEKNSFFKEIKEGSFNAKEIEAKLYKKLSGIKADKNNEIHILVDDETAFRKNGGNENTLSITKGIVRITKGVKDSELTPYIYRTHYEAKNNFIDVVKELGEGKLYQKTKFIEGITGNNSTDRLVRNEDIDETWGYRHLHAMKEQIAIFDERIFAKVFGVKDEDFYKEEELLKSAKTKIVSKLEKEKKDIEENVKKKLIEKDIKKVDASKSIDELRKILEQIGGKYKSSLSVTERVIVGHSSKDLLSYAKSNSYSGTAFAQKGVMVFNLFRDLVNEDRFNLCGLHMDKENDFNSSLDETNLHSICTIIAQITWKDKRLNIEWFGDAEKQFKNKFHHMSIHQGLLDKMYEAFGLKHSNTEELKEEVTKDFYELFSKDPALIGIEKDDQGNDDKFFLPGLCIHSGRSKPSKTDMPQHLPFIQYASIENAVLDCKYSLVELLDFARYEHK